jgi:integrase
VTLGKSFTIPSSTITATSTFTAKSACQNENFKTDIHEVKSPSDGLRFHDLRHHAITELAQSQASDQTVMAIARHVSPTMLAQNPHVRTEAMR